MSTSRALACATALLAAGLCADEIIDYIDALDKEFTRSSTENSVRITVRPRLLERAFATFVNDRLEKKPTRQALLKEWRPVFETLRHDGYVFELDYLLLNQNLDSSIEVPLGGDLRRYIFLINSKGETGMAYKIVGDKVDKLDFMYPKRALTCYFNTVNDRGVPLLRQGVMTLTLKILKFNEVLPELTFAWAVPLQYSGVLRSQTLATRFGTTPFRTLMPYASNINNRVELAPLMPTVPRPAAAPTR